MHAQKDSVHILGSRTNQGNNITVHAFLFYSLAHIGERANQYQQLLYKRIVYYNLVKFGFFKFDVIITLSVKSDYQEYKTQVDNFLTREPFSISKIVKR